MICHDKSVMCDVDGCCSTNVWDDIFEWKVGDETIHLCEYHLDCQPKTPHTKIYKKEKVYGMDK